MLERRGRWLVSSPNERREGAAQMTAALRLNLTLLSTLALLVGFYFIYQALDGAVVRRREEIATLRSLGVTELSIRQAWLLEAVALGLAGGALGGVLGWLGAQGTVRLVSRSVNALYQSSHVEHAPFAASELAFSLAARGGLQRGRGLVSGAGSGAGAARAGAAAACRRGARAGRLRAHCARRGGGARRRAAAAAAARGRNVVPLGGYVSTFVSRADRGRLHGAAARARLSRLLEPLGRALGAAADRAEPAPAAHPAACDRRLLPAQRGGHGRRDGGADRQLRPDDARLARRALSSRICTSPAKARRALPPPIGCRPRPGKRSRPTRRWRISTRCRSRRSAAGGGRPCWPAATWLSMGGRRMAAGSCGRATEAFDPARNAGARAGERGLHAPVPQARGRRGDAPHAFRRTARAPRRRLCGLRKRARDGAGGPAAIHRVVGARADRHAHAAIAARASIPRRCARDCGRRIRG